MTLLAKFDPGFSNLAVLFALDLLISRAISFLNREIRKNSQVSEANESIFFLLPRLKKLIAPLINWSRAYVKQLNIENPRYNFSSGVISSFISLFEKYILYKTTYLIHY